MKEIRSQTVDETATGLAAVQRKKVGRKVAGAACCALIILIFLPVLVAWIAHAAASQLHSYVLLIPFVTGYLLYVQRDALPTRHATSSTPALLAVVAGLAALAIAEQGKSTLPLSENDYLSLMILSFLCLLTGAGFFFLGRAWMAAAAFPVTFLFFMIPMPDAVANALETASQFGSAETANWFFAMSGMPFLREGNIFQLPNIVIQVAQECSGIRSSWILFITSLVASNLFLRTPWRRVALVAFVIPLGLLRNGFRVFVIGLICVKYGPRMIESAIHRRGGPFFFALSLIPLFFLLWWLRKKETEKARG